MLGKLIVQDGAISQAQLDEAIQNQVVFGGRLGTSLLELGYINSDQLGNYLAKMHRVPAINLEELNACPKGALNALGGKMASKHQCIPISVDKSSLSLVMMNPTDLAAIDEISFATSKRIKPHAAPELVILSLLEKYYDIARPMRFISFANNIVKEPVKKEVTKAAPAPKIKEKVGGVDVPKKVSHRTIDKGKNAARKAEETKKPIEITDKEAAEAIQDISKLTQVAPAEEVMEPVELEEEVVEELELLEEVEDELELLEELPELLNLEEARERLLDVDDRDELSRVVLSFAHSYFKRSALFITRLGKVVGWYGMGDGIDATMVKSVMLPLNEPSIFKTVFDSQAFFLGAIPETKYNDLFLKTIGGEQPQSAFLIPILFNGQVVNILYGDNGEGQPAPFDISELLILAPKVPLAFEQLIIKKKNQPDTPPA